MNSYPFIPAALIISLAQFMAPQFAPAQVKTIGYVEKFALAENREDALKELVAGTQDYYWFHALHYEQTGQSERLDALIEAWAKRDPHNAKLKEIQNRKAILNYGNDPKGTLEYLKRELGLRFEHQRDNPGEEPDLPTSLEQKLVAWQAYLDVALKQEQNLGQIRDSALIRLLRDKVKLGGAQRRDLLNRIRRPDHPELVALVLEDLATKESGGFGEFPIHRLLLPGQLDALAKARPDLMRNRNFISSRITKLWPGEDESMAEPAIRADFLGRVWEFVKPLDPSFNDLKIQVLAQVLDLARRRGEFDRAQFLEYLALPRNAGYVNPDYLKSEPVRNSVSALGADHSALLRVPVVHDDEPLVRAYLEHFFLTEVSYEAFGRYIRGDYLQRVFAETKLLAGEGDPSKWFSILGPAGVKALKERVDLEFAATNQERFTTGDPVKLAVDVKNVKTLIVRVYEINTLSYYLNYVDEVATDLDLDGLVANSEEIYNYAEPPLRRVRRDFDFPTLVDKRGVWVVEFIGNGKSSRALVRKGSLQYLAQTTAAGEAMRVFDENNELVPDASIWAAGREYAAGKDGTIMLPFSEDPGRRPLVLVSGDYAALDYFDHPSEDYVLSAGFYVDREELLTGGKAAVLIRPSLTVNGEPAPVSVLEDVKLTLVSTDLKGVRSSDEIVGFELPATGQAIHIFKVPERLISLEFQIEGKVDRPSRGDKVTLSATHEVTLNTIDQTMETRALHLSKFGGEFVLELFGKGGEPLAGRSVQLGFSHEGFDFDRWFSLKTDAAGRANLGALGGIRSVQAKSEGAKEMRWDLPEDRASRPTAIHAIAGGTIQIPYFSGAIAGEVSLLEMRNGTFVADGSGTLKVEGGYLIAEGLPAGDHSLYFPREEREIILRVANGKEESGYALAGNRHLQLAGIATLQLTSVTVDKGDLVIKLGGADSLTRTHIFGTRFLPDYDSFAALSNLPSDPPVVINRGRLISNYLSGRIIGEEYRYIIDRRYAERFPGNMLARPGLLLNPWAIRETETGTQVALGGEEYGLIAPGSDSERKGGGRGEDRGIPPANSHPNLNFLKNVGPLIPNIPAPKDGVIRVPLEMLGDRQYLRVVAVGPGQTVSRDLALDNDGTDFDDVRLTDGLDATKPFSEQKRVTVLAKGEELIIRDPSSAEIEVYDSLSRAYGLFTTLNPDPYLAEFGFILRWGTMEEKEKRELYSKYACHELSFWISRHDVPFFRSVIEPYLANKRDKTFMDDYLVENDLAKYLSPWEFGKLNVVERVLLARRIGGGEQEETARLLADLVALLPPDTETDDHLFETALRGSALGKQDIHLGAALKQVEELRRENAQAGDREKNLVRSDLERMEAPDTRKEPQRPMALPEIEPAKTAKPGDEQVESKGEGKKQNRYWKEQKDAVRSIDDLVKNGTVSMEADGDKYRGTFSMAGVLTESDFKDVTRALNLYRKMPKTHEWAENNYYRLRITEQGPDLIEANPFWEDFAKWDGEGAFFSGKFIKASENFSEMMLAMAVLGLPDKQGEHNYEVNEGALEIGAASPLVVFHKEILPAKDAGEKKVPLLVGQSFFDPDDRFRQTPDGQVDKFVTDEFLRGKTYGCQVVVTNPTSAVQKVEVLTQIPSHSMPVGGSLETRSVPLRLDPFTTQKVEYYFYFPVATGKTPHYPAQVSVDGESVASAPAADFSVVDKITKVDEASWDYLSQWADSAAVLNYLEGANLGRTDLARMGWRLRDPDFFNKVIALLSRRHRYDETVWSYGIFNDALPVARQFLLHQDGFLTQCGRYLDADLVSINPIDRHLYEHLEYSPLVNARAHQLGTGREITNEAFHSHYHAFLEVLSYQGKLGSSQHAAATYYLLLQDRVDDGLAHFDKVKSEELSEKIQYDFLTCYVAFYQGDTDGARATAAKYSDHPVERWRQRFSEVTSQLDEIDGKAAAVQDKENRQQAQDELASKEPGFELKVEDRSMKLTYQNVKELTVNYYEMDLEFLFSTNPFVQGGGDRFSIIRPNASNRVILPEGGDEHTLKLPVAFQNKNVLVEVVGAGQKRTQAYYANSLTVKLSEDYGRLQVTHDADDRPIPKTYVKVYAMMEDGSVKFFKDGYTDLRGKFDYTSLNTDEITRVRKFAVLVMHDEHGALVKEVDAPAR